MKTYHDIAGDGGSDISAQVSRRLERVRARMAAVGCCLAVFSGKGGVGKSTVTANLAAALALRGRRVGVLDADLNGPCVARMLGVQGRTLNLESGSVEPACGPLGVKLASMDLLLPHTAAPVEWCAPALGHAQAWRSAIEATALGEFLSDTAWGELDFLLIDLPPGADRLATLHCVLPRCDGLLAVTVPSEVAHVTVRRAINSARLLNAVLLGVIENMSGYVCAHCGAVQHLFPGLPENRAAVPGVPRLASIPFDPQLAWCCDHGVPVVLAHEGSAAAGAFKTLAAGIATGSFVPWEDA